MDGVASFERFERYTGFTLCAVLFSLCRHLSSPHLHLLLTQHSLFMTCPVFGVHYIEGDLPRAIAEVYQDAKQTNPNLKISDLRPDYDKMIHPSRALKR